MAKKKKLSEVLTGKLKIQTAKVLRVNKSLKEEKAKVKDLKNQVKEAKKSGN
jgi:hypothetical protein